MIDYSNKIPDLCWYKICQYLSVWDIAQLSSTCQILRHMLWSRQSSLWMYLIHLKVQSSVFCQSIKALCDEDENEDAIIVRALDREGEGGEFPPADFSPSFYLSPDIFVDSRYFMTYFKLILQTYESNCKIFFLLRAKLFSMFMRNKKLSLRNI